MSEGQAELDRQLVESAGNEPLTLAPESPKSITPTYDGIATEPCTPEEANILHAPVNNKDIEIRPDGIIYLPEIKFRRVLDRAFMPGGWAMKPLGVTMQDNQLFYKGQLWARGKFRAESIGEQEFFPDNRGMTMASAHEAAKSNCLMRCCKDLGIASECWDPQFIRQWKRENAVEVWCEGIGRNNKDQKKPLWRRKDSDPIGYPWKEQGTKQQDPTGEEHPVAVRPPSPPVPSPASPAAPVAPTVESMPKGEAEVKAGLSMLLSPMKPETKERIKKLLDEFAIEMEPFKKFCLATYKKWPGSLNEVQAQDVLNHLIAVADHKEYPEYSKEKDGPLTFRSM